MCHVLALLFSDDTRCLGSAQSRVPSPVSDLQLDLNSLSLWSLINSLVFNVAKSAMFSFPYGSVLQLILSVVLRFQLSHLLVIWVYSFLVLFHGLIIIRSQKLKRFLSKSKGCRVVKSTTGPQCKPTRNKHGMVT